MPKERLSNSYFGSLAKQQHVCLLYRTMQPVAVSLYDVSDHLADSNNRPRLSHGHGALINDKQAARLENLNNVL